MQRTLSASLVLAVLAQASRAQDAELYLCNSNTVRSTLAHANTNFYPYAPTCPPPYSVAGPGVLPDTRSWLYVPPLRYQLGTAGQSFFTLTGMIQTIRVGAPIVALPAANHYQMRMGIAPTDPVTGGGKYQRQHSASLPDLFSLADAPAIVNTRPRFEISTTLGTPIPFGPTELCLYLQFRGGEQQDDPNNCQTTANDYYGGVGPGGLAHWGFTTGTIPSRTVTLNTGGQDFSPRVGLLIAEPVFTATGPHANAYIAVTLEDYRGIHACHADWSTNTLGKLAFDVRAGSNYGTSGGAVVLMNFGPSWFPGSFPSASFGNLKLNPTDPALDALTSLPLNLIAGGIYAGGGSVQVPVPALGPSAVGQFLKTQAIVFNAGLSNLTFTTASSILIE